MDDDAFLQKVHVYQKRGGYFPAEDEIALAIRLEREGFLSSFRSSNLKGLPSENLYMLTTKGLQRLNGAIQ